MYMLYSDLLVSTILKTAAKRFDNHLFKTATGVADATDLERSLFVSRTIDGV